MANPPILATRNLGLDIGGARIVADVSLEVAEGELLGIIGPNGAGKTSLFNLLSGLYRPTSGSIFLSGREITQQPTFLRTREGIGRTFQVSSVFPLLTVHENVRIAAEASAGGTLRLWRRAPKLERAHAAIERVGLGAHAHVRAGALAHGDKRRLEIAMLLAADKPVLLLDEPMAGLSAEHVPQLVDLIRSINTEERKTV
ncbi:MAG TPA: ATP-binding cassette domain-containing protein, partial [Casimicrobiaceae bacterium]|nr:ATP-binding cassette domain-containing protein [Casimicrobiaceae bacterium]